MIDMGRVLPGIVMVLLWVLLLFTAPFALFWLVIVIFCGIGLSEYARMTNASPEGVYGVLFLVMTLLPVLASYWGTTEGVMAGVFAGLFGVIFLVFRLYTRLENVLETVTLNGFAILYIAFCSAHIVLIRHAVDGPSLIFMLTAITAGSDTGAYYAGRAFGRRKLCPNISPGKTVAGGVGGVLSGVVLAVIIALFLLPRFNILRVATSAAVLAMVGIAGDLTESMIKRATGVKDSGTILAGHGGILDRMDSLLLTAPFLFYLLVFEVLS